MARFPCKLIALLPAVVIMVAVNAAVDPGNVVHEGCESAAATAIVSGRSVDFSGLDDRLMHKHVVEELANPLDVIVLGSSRGMLIHSALFPSERFFNHNKNFKTRLLIAIDL